jgi:hypothetical protein
MLKVEMILMVDLTTARTQAMGVTLALSCERGQCPAFARASQNMTAVTTLLSALPPPSVDRVDRLYRQLEEILAITAT